MEDDRVTGAARFALGGALHIVRSFKMRTVGEIFHLGVSDSYSDEERRQISQYCTGHIQIFDFRQLQLNAGYSFQQFELGRLPWHLEIYPRGKRNKVR